MYNILQAYTRGYAHYLVQINLSNIATNTLCSRDFPNKFYALRNIHIFNILGPPTIFMEFSVLAPVTYIPNLKLL